MEGNMDLNNNIDCKVDRNQQQIIPDFQSPSLNELTSFLQDNDPSFNFEIVGNDSSQDESSRIEFDNQMHISQNYQSGISIHNGSSQDVSSGNEFDNQIHIPQNYQNGISAQNGSSQEKSSRIEFNNQMHIPQNYQSGISIHNGSSQDVSSGNEFDNQIHIPRNYQNGISTHNGSSQEKSSRIEFDNQIHIPQSYQNGICAHNLDVIQNLKLTCDSKPSTVPLELPQLNVSQVNQVLSSLNTDVGDKGDTSLSDFIRVSHNTKDSDDKWDFSQLDNDFGFANWASDPQTNSTVHHQNELTINNNVNYNTGSGTNFLTNSKLASSTSVFNSTKSDISDIPLRIEPNSSSFKCANLQVQESFYDNQNVSYNPTKPTKSAFKNLVLREMLKRKSETFSQFNTYPTKQLEATSEGPVFNLTNVQPVSANQMLHQMSSLPLHQIAQNKILVCANGQETVTSNSENPPSESILFPQITECVQKDIHCVPRFPREETGGLCENNYVTDTVHNESASPSSTALDKSKHVHNNYDSTKRFFCEFCAAQFKEIGNLKAHVRTHTKERPFLCEICQKAFRTRSSFNEHQITHSDKRPKFVCTICNAVLLSAPGLVKHVKSHNGEKNYKCQYCEKAFTTASHHKRHERIHTNDKPHICDVCGEAFIQKGNLKLHSRIHDDVKPFQCQVCKKGFCFESSFLVHSAKCKNVKEADN